MSTQSEILKILIDEYNRSSKIIGGSHKRYNDSKYDKLSSSNEALELLLEVIDDELAKIEQKEIYIISVSYNNQLVMTIGCFLHRKYSFQLNNFITKHKIHLDKNNNLNTKNISMYLHSYASSLFNSKYILVKEPLEVMRNKLLSYFPDVIILDTYNLAQSDYENAHEMILGCNYDEVEYFGIGNGGESLIIKTDENFKNLYKERPDLQFNFVKITG